MNDQPAIENMSFEDAYAELNAVLEQMEADNTTLEETVDLYERGGLLAAHCETLLQNAELRVQQLDEPDVG